MIKMSDNIKALSIQAANKRIDRLFEKGYDAFKILGLTRKLSTHKALIDADYEKAEEILNNPESLTITHKHKGE